LRFQLSQACPHLGGTKKTKQVTLPPLFSGCYGQVTLPAAGNPSRESQAQGRALQGLADLGGLQVWLKQTVKGWWGLSSGWDVSKSSETPGGLDDEFHWKSLSTQGTSQALSWSHSTAACLRTGLGEQEKSPSIPNTHS
jgi:hypothetical protein